jgi:hypothetical protein
MNTPRHSFPPNMAVDDGVYPFPLASNVVPIHPHRLAQATRDAEMLEAIEQRLREGSPKSGARHVRLTDSVQVGENEFEEPHNIRADLVALAAGVVSALILVAGVAS